MRVVGQSFEIPSTPDPWRVAIVADTHSKPHPRITEHLRALAPGLILHAGDIGDLSVLQTFRAIAPLVAVRGNIDVVAPEVPDQIDLSLTRGDKLALKILLTHIAVYGPRLRADVRKRAKASDARLVVCGHSHVPFLTKDGAVAVFNPGSIGPRRFTLPITFGVMTLAGTRLTLEHVDCESGEPWLPPQRPPR